MPLKNRTLHYRTFRILAILLIHDNNFAEVKAFCLPETVVDASVPTLGLANSAIIEVEGSGVVEITPNGYIDLLDCTGVVDFCFFRDSADCNTCLSADCVSQSLRTLATTAGSLTMASTSPWKLSVDATNPMTEVFSFCLTCIE